MIALVLKGKKQAYALSINSNGRFNEYLLYYRRNHCYRYCAKATGVILAAKALSTGRNRFLINLSYRGRSSQAGIWMFGPDVLARQAADLVSAVSTGGKAVVLLASIQKCAVIGRRHNGTALLF